MTDFISFLGPPVSERLANMINKGLRRYPDQAACKRTYERYLRPENIPHLQAPDVNDGVVQDLSFRGAELMMKKVQVVGVTSFLTPS